MANNQPYYNDEGALVGGDGNPTGPVGQAVSGLQSNAQIDEGLQSLIEMIQGAGEGDTGIVGRFMSAADRLHSIATGEGDTAFEFEEGRALAGTRDQFRRRGLGFSGAAQNAANRTRQQFGSMRLQRQDAATEQELNTLSSGVETAALPYELMIAQLAANKAGSSGGGGGLLDSVICTALHRNGDLPEAIYRADTEYGRGHVSLTTFRGYHCWAKPLVRLSERSPWVYRIMRFLGWHWAHHMAFLMGVHPTPDRIGATLLWTLKPACTVLGAAIRGVRKFRRRHGLIANLGG